MLVIKYTGGLGNQMFQYALGISLSRRFPEEKIYADLSRYHFLREHEGFVLSKYFYIEVKEPDDKYLKKICWSKYYCSRLPIGTVKYKLPVWKLERIDEILEKRNSEIGIITDYMSTIYNQDVFNLNCQELSMWHFKGNWINPRYWEGYEEDVTKAFVFREELLSAEDRELLEEMQSTESVAVHIRRGDYVGQYGFDLCGEDYYARAVNELRREIGGKEMTIYIFSDMQEIQLSFLRGVKYKIISHPNASGIDMWMMSKCRHNIIANSTFSFWSAYLNNNRKKVVIAPLYAYRRREMYRIFPVPETWSLIDNLK